ncbi:glycerate kinase [Virgibacillus byunsanensis]|uniref:Glycerate kinase n=1 Tax=Virgibacillus byunsanensis TaxID=570945 RepID=A0ABW3LF31_9BACI
MKIVIAPDSYKGSLSQVEAANVMKAAIREVEPMSEIILKPMADGGEGTLDALMTAAPLSEEIPVSVVGPLGGKIASAIGIVNKDTAIIEIASIAGLPLTPETSRDPYQTTTYGIGEAIRIALDYGIRKFVVGLGGSATNDGGFGMLCALGAEMKNASGTSVSIYGKDLMNITHVELGTLDPRIAHCEIYVASDVDNPLVGKRGASYIFGPQKGATPVQIDELDQAMKNYSKLCIEANSLSASLAVYPGAGAAGGLGFAFLTLGATLDSGAKLVADTTSLEDSLKSVDLVLTGEGKSDMQTIDGKAPGYVAGLAKKYNIPVILIAGTIVDHDQLLQKKFTEVHAITSSDINVKQAMREAKMLLFNKTKQVFKDWVKLTT